MTLAGSARNSTLPLPSADFLSAPQMILSPPGERQTKRAVGLFPFVCLMKEVPKNRCLLHPATRPCCEQTLFQQDNVHSKQLFLSAKVQLMSADECQYL